MSSNKVMIEMIETLNKLQNKLVSLGVNHLVKQLPQIAVVGSQSAGKSSVLESFVGRDFLPRGEDVVTRRPLILQLKQNRDDDKTYAKFNHSQQIFTDFNEIRLEIEAETDRLVPDSQISSDPINLMIKSPEVLDLNLVDLPGMTKVAVGKQPEDIETIIKDLILEYISKENCLILAVTPANQDLSTSDAIKLSRGVDPEGNRTIGVLTKLDLMNEGTDARNILTNNHKITLKRGFIGVINRSPKDIENNKPLSEAITSEKTFFAKHSAYKDIIHKLGVENLQKYLQNQLAEHLFVELPTLREKFKEELFGLKEKIENIEIKINEINENDLIYNSLELLRQNFNNEIGIGNEVPVDHLNGGANISVIMNIEFPKAIEGIPRSEENIKEEIRISIMNINGSKLKPFIPNDAYISVVAKQIELMRLPSLKCMQSVVSELENIIKKCANKIGHFPQISEIYIQFLMDFLRECKKNCKNIINHKLDTEKAYINTNNYEFIRNIEAHKQNNESLFGKLMVNRVPNQPIKEGTLIFSRENQGWSKAWSNSGNGTNNWSKNESKFFSIENNFIKLYNDKTKSNSPEKFDLTNIQLICDQNWFQLKGNGFNLKFKVDSNNRITEWVTPILEAAQFNNNNSLDKVTTENKYPVQMDTQTNEFLELVLIYTKIEENILKDTIPKICHKELIDTMGQFIATKLRACIESKDITASDLVNFDSFKEELISCKTLKTLYEEALQTMNEVLKPHIKNTRKEIFNDNFNHKKIKLQ